MTTYADIVNRSLQLLGTRTTVSTAELTAQSSNEAIQAQIAIDQYNKQAEQASLQLDVDYRDSKINLQNSINTIRAQKENKDLATEVYEVTRSNYQQGLSGLTDLLDAENSLLVAENNYNSALLQYKLAEIGLIKANGNLNTLLN